MNALLDPKFQASVLQVLLGLSVLLPLAEKIAAHTKNKVDDGIVKAVASFVGSAFTMPRLRQGDGK